MKRFLLFFFLLFFSLSTLWAQNNSTPFITKWSGTTSIRYQVEGAVSYTLIDSTTSPMVVASGNISTSSSTISITTGLNINKTYYLHIVFNNNATVRSFYNSTTTNLSSLREVVSWGNTQWTTMQQAFYYATNLTSVPASPPDLRLVTNFQDMFRNATTFNGDISNWDVSNGTNFSYMFYNATAFTSDLSEWNVGNGTNFGGMFYFATSFNGDLSKWDVSNGANFSQMFFNATSFNGDLSKWDVSNGANFSQMFFNATSFNGDLSEWDVSNGANFSFMFANARAFTSDLSGWDVSNGTDFSYMFGAASVFNSDLSGWEVGNGTNFANMFSYTTAFTSDLSEWNVGNGTNFSLMFYGATAFNSDLSGWDVSNGANFSYMFANARAFTSDLSGWDVSNGTNFGGMFGDASVFNSDLSGWEVSNGTVFSWMFYGATSFNSDLSNWDLSSVSSTTGIQDIFTGAGMDCYNLSNTIIGWANHPNTPSGQTGINLTGLSYNAAADAALNNILKAPTANGGKGWAGNAGTVVPDAVCMPIALPLQLLSFQAVKNDNNTADIKWEIIEDDEVQHYTIEHSTPNTPWVSLASIVPNATTNHTQAYTYTHTHPTAGTNIYRLKITDVWGKTTYSKIGFLAFDTKNSTLIYPNPTSSFVNIISSKEQMKVIALYNTIGQKAFEESIDATEYTIDLNHLSDGVYFLKVTYTDGNTLIERIVKQ